MAVSTVRAEVSADLRALAQDARRSADGRAIVCITLDLPAGKDNREEVVAVLEEIADEVRGR